MLFVVGVLVGVNVSWTASAHGSVRFSLRVSSARVSDGGSVTLSIRMQTAGSAETAGVGLISSGWPDRGVFGAPLAFGSPHVSGGGAAITGSFGSAAGGLPGGVPLCMRGANAPDGDGVDVSLPPNSVSTLRYAVRYAARPWPGMSPTIGAFANVPAIGPGQRVPSLGSVDLMPAGPTGIRIDLSARGAGRPVAGTDDQRVSRGQPVLIQGRTDPRVSGAHVTISAESYARPGRNEGLRRTRVGTARTTSRGTFVIGWRPRIAGAYMIVASLQGLRRGDVADRGCDLTLSVR